jgi:transmembrane sensor
MSYPTGREEQAAYWYLKLQEPDVSAERIRAALAWQADAENRAAFERVEAFWRAWPAGATAPVVSRPPPRRHRIGSWLGVAATLAIISVGVWSFVSQRERSSAVAEVREYATSVGQTRTVLLEDGSKVILGGATSVRTSFTNGVRRIVMSDGEALFFVAKDAQRPFIVDVPNGSAQALGTTFNVHRGPDEAMVTVLEGVVEVKPPNWRDGSAAMLKAGTQVALTYDGRVGSVRRANPQEIVSWQSGRIIFIDRTLRSVVADLNRYSSKPVTLAANHAAELRISGNIDLHHIDSWLRGLQPAFGLELVENEHGLVLLSRAEAH